jgi:hypothetical protein
MAPEAIFVGSPDSELRMELRKKVFTFYIPAKFSMNGVGVNQVAGKAATATTQFGIRAESGFRISYMAAYAKPTQMFICGTMAEVFQGAKFIRRISLAECEPIDAYHSAQGIHNGFVNPWMNRRMA